MDDLEREVAALLGSGDDVDDRPRSRPISDHDTHQQPSPSTSWYGRTLDEIEDDRDAIIRSLRELWPSAKRGGATTVVVAFALRELARLDARRQAIEGEAGI